MLGFQQCRCICTSIACYGKRNFRKFLLYNKRGTRQFKQEQAINRDPELFYDMGVRQVGVTEGNKFVMVPELIPELVVPELKDFKLKPYVSYKAADVIQSEFTPKDLFDAVYSEKIVDDFRKGKLNDAGEPLDPSSDEKLTPDKAYNEARKTGSDLFSS